MYRIAICDDEYDFLELVERRVEKYCEEKQISVVMKTYGDSDILVEDIESGRMFDAYILDIEMKGYSGIEVARIIEEHSNTAITIFLTAYSDYAIEACGMNIMRYVLKTRLDAELDEVLDVLFLRLKMIENSKPYLISNQRRYIKLSQRDVIYIYKYQKNVIFVLVGGKEERERTTLQEVYEKIGNGEWFFLDRGIILNLYHVQKIVKDVISMTEGHHIMTNISRIKDLKEYLHEYWGDIV